MIETSYPVIDPETGEYLAGDDEERFALVRELAEQLIAAHRAARREAEIRRTLEVLMRPAEAVAIDGWSVSVHPPGPARRALNRQAILQHAEALAPLGLAPREAVDPLIVWPTVSELASPKARKELARLGLTPETFLLHGAEGAPRIVVGAPDD